MLTGDVRLLHRPGQGQWLLHCPIQSSIAWGFLLAPGVCDVNVSGMHSPLCRVLFPGLAPQLQIRMLPASVGMANRETVLRVARTIAKLLDLQALSHEEKGLYLEYLPAYHTGV